MRYTTESFIEKIKTLEQCQNVSFEKLTYVNYTTKVILTCHEKDSEGNEHGDFPISPGHLLAGEGCPICRYIKSANKKRRTLYDVIRDARAVHGDKYDYSQIEEYKNDRVKYPIICPEHGVFFQTFNNHIKAKQGCPYCGQENSRKNRITKFEDFLERANKKHNNKYDYSKVQYNVLSDKIVIICPEHGEFKMTASNHLWGQGCPTCARINNGIKRRLTKEEFIERAREIHGDKYDYSQVEYVNNTTKVNIICPAHGVFPQEPSNHLQGNGCPKCVPLESKSEEELLEYIRTLTNDDVVSRERSILNKNEIDIYIPSKKIGIEFDGLFWHNELRRDKDYHINKTIECEKKGIRLIHIFEDEWLFKKDIIKSMLKNILGVIPNKIHARKCEVREVDAKEGKMFLNRNHIQGNCQSSLRYGLYYENELVSLMTFGKSRHFVGNGKGEWELLRFCNKLDTSVVGGASKLFKHFVDEHNPQEVISYADRRWSKGNIYDILGFTKYNESKPNYYYVVGDKRVYRFNMRKSVLVKKYGCPQDMTEKAFCFSKKWYRIYDCGCHCYRWQKNLA